MATAINDKRRNFFMALLSHTCKVFWTRVHRPHLRQNEWVSAEISKQNALIFIGWLEIQGFLFAANTRKDDLLAREEYLVVGYIDFV